MRENLRGLSILELLISITLLTLVLSFAIYILSLNAKLLISNREHFRKLLTAQSRIEYLVYNRDKLTLASDTVLYDLLYQREVLPGSSSDAIYAFYFNYVRGYSLYFQPDSLRDLRIATRIALYDSSPDLYLVTVYVYKNSLNDAIRLTKVIKSLYR